MATGALNLATMQPTSDSRTPEQREMLQAFAPLLYNGWSHPEVGRRASAHYLPKLAASGMTYAVFVGSMIALDPAHLDSAQNVEAMGKSLPPEWAAQRAKLNQFWS